MSQIADLSTQMNSTSLNSQMINISMTKLQKQSEFTPTKDLKEDISDESIKIINKSSNLQAATNLFKGFIGAGILALPLGFYQAGYLLSAIVLLFFVGVTYYAVKLVLKIVDDILIERGEQIGTEITNKQIYTRCLGNPGNITYKIFLVMYQMGCGIGYEIFFINFFEIVFEILFGWENSSVHRLIFLFMTLLILIPMTLIKNFHYFVYWSYLANILIIISLVFITIFNINQMATISSEQIKLNFKNLENYQKLPSFSGIAVFAFECIGIINPVRNSMKNPQDFKKPFFQVSTLICIIYVGFSSLCCWGIGPKLQSPAIMGLQKSHGAFVIFQAFYAIALVISYNVQLFPAYQVFEEISYVKKFQQKTRGSKAEKFFRDYCIRFLTMLFVFVIAYYAKNFGAVLNFVGACAGTMISFVLPFLAFQFFYKKKISLAQTIINVLLMIITVVLGGFSVYDSIKQIFTES